MNPALRFKVGIIIEPPDNAICDPSGWRGTAVLSATIVVVVYKQLLTLTCLKYCVLYKSQLYDLKLHFWIEKCVLVHFYFLVLYKFEIFT